MTPEWTANALQALAMLGGMVTAAAAFGLWYVRATLVSKEEAHRQRVDHDLAHEAIEQRLAEGEIKFAALHADLQRMPDIKDFQALTGRVALVEGVVQTQSAKIDGLHEILSRVDRHLNMLLEFHLKERS